jgi:uncharacterized membrane protein YkvA (DUF1232 family)
MPEVKRPQPETSAPEGDEAETVRSKPARPEPARPRTRKASAAKPHGPEKPVAGSEPAPKRRARASAGTARSRSAAPPPDPLLEEAERRASEEAFDGELPPLPSTGLLSFYDRLRARIVTTVEKKGGRLGAKSVKALLLVPDMFVLLVRLTLDPEVPRSARALIGGAIAYFVLPVDLMPEAILGGAGYLEDLVLATAVLAHTFGDDLEPYARKHWSGPEDIRKVISDVTGAAQGLVGANVYDRLRRLLARRGVEVED